MKGSATIPGEVIGLADSDEIEVEFDYSPGSPAQTCGPPESCDPGEGPEIDGLTAYRGGEKIALSNEEDEKLCQWLYEHHDFDDDDDGPDWDAERDRQIDDRLTGDA